MVTLLWRVPSPRPRRVSAFLERVSETSLVSILTLASVAVRGVSGCNEQLRTPRRALISCAGCSSDILLTLEGGVRCGLRASRARQMELRG